jgi:tRNA-splicing ligase RtcB
MKIYGTHDADTIAQLERCVAAEDGAIGVLCADGHKGYSMPIGGVVAYRDHVSPSGVGYDIACGNMAVRTNIRTCDVPANELVRWADEIARRVSFGIGRVNNEPVDHPVLDAIKYSPVREQRKLIQLAENQLGTVGSGNHYVDILAETGWEDVEDLYYWVAVHFGSRGFGHKTASMFMNAAKGLPMTERAHEGEMDSPPLMIPIASHLGSDYIAAMTIAGEYAYAGREVVVQKVLDIMGAKATDTIHNHHNFAWREQHFGIQRWVVRKGATPAFPSQRGFVGGSMGDYSVILKGVPTSEAVDSLFSVMHGAGRIMSRRKAAGKSRYVKGRRIPISPGLVDFAKVQQDIRDEGIILRGAGADEAPEVYRPLMDVLEFHKGTVDVEEVLRPVVVVMAGADVEDPYKD